MMKKEKTQSYLLKIWYQPSRTVKTLLYSDIEWGHRVALVIAGLFGALVGGRAYLAAEAPAISWIGYGLVGGICGLYILALLLRNFSRLFGGEALCVEVRTALGLAILPWLILNGILLILLYNEVDEITIRSSIPFLFGGLIYGYIIVLLSVAAGLGVSVLRAFVCLCLALLVPAPHQPRDPLHPQHLHRLHQIPTTE